MHNTQSTLIKHKLTKIAYGTIAIVILFTLRLFYLQINLGAYFIDRGKKNFIRIENTKPLRGNILDCNGTLLATNRPVINAYWCGTGNRALSGDQLNLLQRLEHITNTPIRTDKSTIRTIAYREKYKKRVLIAKDLSMEQLSQIEEQFPNHANIILETEFERYYPFSSSASHVLGYLGRQLDSNTFGRMGLEKVFQEQLRGQHGTIVKTINSVGRSIANVELQKARTGSDVATTLNIALQQLAERVFPDDQSGTLILMDPYNGDIKTLVCQPAFDPSLFLRPISHETWNNMQIDQPFLNRAFGASYPIGSIFKLVSTSAGLETGIIHEDDVMECKGFYYFGKRKYRCSRIWGHGELTTQQAVAKSCNILFFDIGKNIDIDVLSDYGRRFGLGEPTNSLFPEKTGLVPSRRWKHEVKGERWWPGETLSVAIGQSFLLATPIQITRMIASIFTGYLVRPRILLNEPIESEPLNIKQETREFLHKAMRSAVKKGTGQRVKRVKDIEIYVKTSTAQTSGLDKRKLGKKYLEHGWFVAYFRYKDYDPLTMVILVENAGTSRIPASIAKDFLIEYKQLMDKQHDNKIS